jgi:methylated-DNA-protein-cysteine methyltransferase-like protein
MIRGCLGVVGRVRDDRPRILVAGHLASGRSALANGHGGEAPRGSVDSGCILQWMSDRANAVLARIRDTPPGFVRAYGDVSPGAPRFAGTVLAGCDDPDVPWHRIVRADGSLAKGERQRALLEAEGVPFRGARVDMRVARLPL